MPWAGITMIAIGLIMAIIGLFANIINQNPPEGAKQIALGIGCMFAAGGIIIAFFIGI